MNALRLVALSLLLSLGGCSSIPEPPAWSSESPDQYPQSEYLTGVGEGPSREAAEQRALAALARIFEVSINEQNSDYSMFSSASGESSTGLNRQLSTRQLIAGTEQLLEGATPVDHWHYQQRHLVLVVLERTGAEQRLRQKITPLDQRTAELVSYAEGGTNPLVRIGALEQARQLQLQRQPLNRNLSVVSGRSVPPLTSVAELEQRIRTRLAGLRFSIEQTGSLQPLLEQAVAKLGAQEADNGLLFSGRLDTEPTIHRQGWYWITGSLELTVADQQGRVLAQQRWPVKASAQQQGMVGKRLQDQLSGAITERLYQLLSANDGVVSD